MSYKSILNIYYDKKEKVIVVSCTEDLKGKYRGLVFHSTKLSPHEIYDRFDLDFLKENEPTSAEIFKTYFIYHFSKKGLNIDKMFSSLKKIIPSIKRKDLESLLKKC